MGGNKVAGTTDQEIDLSRRLMSSQLMINRASHKTYDLKDDMNHPQNQSRRLGLVEHSASPSSWILNHKEFLRVPDNIL